MGFKKWWKELKLRIKVGFSLAIFSFSTIVLTISLFWLEPNGMIYWVWLPLIFLGLAIPLRIFLWSSKFLFYCDWNRPANWGLNCMIDFIFAILVWLTFLFVVGYIIGFIIEKVKGK